MTQRFRSYTEYRVTSEREGQAPKVKRYKSLRPARDRVGRLTHAEPWRFYGSEAERQRYGDALVCCPAIPGGYECGCGGVTVREEADAQRAKLPKLLRVTVEKRAVIIGVSQWEKTDEAE